MSTGKKEEPDKEIAKIQRGKKMDSLFEQLKNEYSKLETEINACQGKKGEYEKKMLIQIEQFKEVEKDLGKLEKEFSIHKEQMNERKRKRTPTKMEGEPEVKKRKIIHTKRKPAFLLEDTVKKTPKQVRPSQPRTQQAPVPQQQMRMHQRPVSMPQIQHRGVISQQQIQKQIMQQQHAQQVQRQIVHQQQAYIGRVPNIGKKP